MDYAAFNSILETMTKDDWIINYDGRPYVYKHDMNLTLALNHSRDSFNEEWATRHPDSHALRVQGFFLYNNAPIRELFLVSVDGGRAILPYPDTVTNMISSVDYNIASIFNDRLDEYLGRSRITVG